MAFLHITDRDTDTEWRVPVTGPRLTIGKAPSNDVVLIKSAVSRQHCTIVKDKGRLFVHDQGSRNGTYVEGLRINGTTPLPDAAPRAR